jgi:hypothetical protein
MVTQYSGCLSYRHFGFKVITHTFAVNIIPDPHNELSWTVKIKWDEDTQEKTLFVAGLDKSSALDKRGTLAQLLKDTLPRNPYPTSIQDFRVEWFS